MQGPRNNTELQRLPAGQFRRQKLYDIERGRDRKVTVHTERKIKLKRAGGRIYTYTEPEDKIYRVSFFKRRPLGDNTSVPFGYIYTYIYKDVGEGL